MWRSSRVHVSLPPCDNDNDNDNNNNNNNNSNNNKVYKKEENYRILNPNLIITWIEIEAWRYFESEIMKLINAKL